MNGFAGFPVLSTFWEDLAARDPRTAGLLHAAIETYVCLDAVQEYDNRLWDDVGTLMCALHRGHLNAAFSDHSSLASFSFTMYLLCRDHDVFIPDFVHGL